MCRFIAVVVAVDTAGRGQLQGVEGSVFPSKPASHSSSLWSPASYQFGPGFSTQRLLAAVKARGTHVGNSWQLAIVLSGHKAGNLWTKGFHVELAFAWL